MSAAYQVQVGNWSYTVVDDCTTSYWAILTGAATDEILGPLYAPGITVTVDPKRSDLVAKVTPNGLYAVTGYPRQSFPNLSTTSYAVNLLIDAPGFRPFHLSVTVPMNTTFPVVVSPVALRRLPVRIQGRVVNATTRAAIAGALVLGVDDPNSAPTVHTTAVRSPLYFDHAGGASAQSVTLNVTGAANLTANSAAGARMIELSVRTGLGAGAIVQLSNASKLIVEYGVVDHLGPGAAASPGQVFFRHALNRSYSAGAATTVQFVGATLAGAAATLSSDANVGDGVLLASALLNSNTLVVDSGTLTEEYHEAGALSDANGYYALDGMGRVQEIFLKASQGALTQTNGWAIEFDQPINQLDFRLS